MSKRNILEVILVVLMILIVRTKGIENIAFQLIVILLIVGLVISIVSVIKYKGSKKQHFYLKIITSLLGAFVAILIIGVAFQNQYPDLSRIYKPIIVILIITILLSITIISCINAIRNDKKN